MDWDKKLKILQIIAEEFLNNGLEKVDNNFWHAFCASSYVDDNFKLKNDTKQKTAVLLN